MGVRCTPDARVLREKLTDGYLITIFFLFPLFPGFSGYQDITRAKYLFFMTATGLWLACAGALTWRGRLRPGRPEAPLLAAGALWLVSLISWLCSPWREASFLGAGRYDGLLTLTGYGACFLGTAAWTRPKRLHVLALGAGTAVCCGVGILQLLGFRALGLFPGGLTYYDRDVLYSGAYLTTVGNTNVLDALLCAALPLCAARYIQSGDGLLLLPLLPAVPVLAFAGGDGAAVAGAALLLLAGPALLTEPERLRRGVRCLGAVSALAGLALAYSPDYTDRVVTPRLTFTAPSLALLAGGAACAGLSLLPVGSVGRLPLRRCFLALDGLAVLGGAGCVWFWPGQSGPIYELKCLLHGSVREEFGSSRLGIWRQCLDLVPSRPLLGGGPGTLALRLDLQFSRYVPETGETLRSYVDNAHSVYLGYLVNQGVLGLGAYLLLIVSALLAAFRGRANPLAVPLALSVLTASVHGLFGLGLCLSEPVFWAVLGLTAACGPAEAGKEEKPCENRA